jgi:glycosyltransferase involved in cell wall biosynthesis
VEKLPLVSVLIPTYNRPHYVTLALESVLAQTYSNIEIIITDDSTNNETQEALAPYIEKYAHITYVKNEQNLGGERNFRKVYDLSHGEYINYLMDDDLFHPEKIERMMKWFFEGDSARIKLVTSYREVIDENGNKLEDSKYTERRYSDEVILNGIGVGNSIISEFNWIGEPTTVLFKREDLTEPFGTFCGRQYRSGVDAASWLTLLAKGNAVYIPDSLSFGRHHESNISKTEDTRLRAVMDWVHLIFHSRKKGFLQSDNDRKIAVKACLDHIHVLKSYISTNRQRELMLYESYLQQEEKILHHTEPAYMQRRYSFEKKTPNKELPLVSILIPTYNRPYYVQLALESVLQQTYPHIEIIIGDDGTNDETKKVLEPYVLCYPFITYYKNDQNIGGELNFQKVYTLSKGEYINYLMDDDLFHPQKIERMMEYYIHDEEKKYKLITSFRPIINEQGEIIPEGIYRRYLGDTAVNGIEAGDSLIDEFNWIGEPTTVLFRREDLNEPYGSFCGRQYYNSVDVAAWLTLLVQGDAVYVKDALSFTRAHENQVGRHQYLRIRTTMDWIHVIFHGKKKGLLQDETKKRRAMTLCLAHIHHVFKQFNLTPGEIREMMYYKNCLDQALGGTK